MGDNGAPDAIPAFYDSLTSQLSNRSGLAAAWQLYNDARVAARQVSWSSIADYLLSLYGNESVDRGQAVFLTTFVVAMAGCGLLTTLIRRRWSSEQNQPPQRTMRKSSAKTSTRTITSSDDDYEDDEDDDSNGSLLHGTGHQLKAIEWSSQPQHQSSDGKET